MEQTRGKKETKCKLALSKRAQGCQLLPKETSPSLSPAEPESPQLLPPPPPPAPAGRPRAGERRVRDREKPLTAAALPTPSERQPGYLAPAGAAPGSEPPPAPRAASRASRLPPEQPPQAGGAGTERSRQHQRRHDSSHL